MDILMQKKNKKISLSKDMRGLIHRTRKSKGRLSSKSLLASKPLASEQKVKEQDKES